MRLPMNQKYLSNNNRGIFSCKGFCTNLALLLVLLAAIPSLAGVKGRFIRYENVFSQYMEIMEIEVYSDGNNILRGHQDWVTDTPAKPDNKKIAQILVDGKNETNIRGTTISGSPGSSYIEIDLGKTCDLDKILVYRSRQGQRVYNDTGYRLLAVLNENRKVVAYNSYNIYNSKDSRQVAPGIWESKLSPSNGPLIGITVKPGDAAWAPIPAIIAVGPQKDIDEKSKKRLAVFQQRNSSENIKQFALKFFAAIDLSLPGLEGIRPLFDKKQYQQALDEYKRHFFKKLAVMDGHKDLYNPTGWTATALDIRMSEDLITGHIVEVERFSASARKYMPGLFEWANFSDVLVFNRFLAGLLKSYGATGKKEILDAWLEMMDDWAINMPVDCDASEKNVRDYFVLNTFHQPNRLFKTLRDISKKFPDCVDNISSATLARALLVMAEEYPPAYWRVVRKTVFNHTFNGFGAT